MVMKARVLMFFVLSTAGCKRANSDTGKNQDTDLPGATEIVSFPSGSLTLHGLLLRPAGKGPFPAVLYNHGSAPGTANNLAFANIAPVFVARGWVFFMPYRRGQGVSESAGPYIGDEIEKAKKAGGMDAAAAVQLRLLQTDHLEDQLAALAWLRSSAFVQSARVAAAGNSFGGIEAVLGAERGGYCAAIDASGAAESWGASSALRERMTEAARNASAPIFFFQAENDFDLSPTRLLSAAMKEAGKPAEMKIYPPFGSSAREGHSFAYRGVALWSEDVLRFLGRNCGP
jgi:dipeptidyl aminopeptidase/acylaminoacyl peptidase